MAITKSIGKNTLGSGNKMTVDLRTYNRSTHNLSYAWRSTMGVGTLVPCMKIPALPGDTFDINIDKKVLTHPTVGPLFGSYKMQVDIFTCPMRLYMSGLHNNMLNVGLNMAQIKIPKFNWTTDGTENPTAEEPHPQVNPSSVMNYLGFKGSSYTSVQKTEKKNALPILSYLDIFKNYYANKQEENFFAIITKSKKVAYNKAETESYAEPAESNFVTGAMIIVATGYNGISTQNAKNNTTITVRQVFVGLNGQITVNQYIKTTLSNLETLCGSNFTDASEGDTLKLAMTYGPKAFGYIIDENYPIEYSEDITETNLKEYPLTELDNVREAILANSPTQEYIINNGSPSQYIEDLLTTDTTNTRKATYFEQSGLLLKTYQSDIFNNWINTEWIEGDNGISAITAIDTSSGEFTIDTLNLAKKVYDMLNRIAVSGGSYRDWIETVYTGGYMMHTETPVYEGGMSCEIEFQEVVSNSATEDEPLGTLAGRGVDTKHKGGNLHIKVNEPCYIMGIVSITPRVDYCQGNDWDNEIDTMDDWHKPALDGIGFQDLTENLMAWWRPNNSAVGKQPAWINYMTNFNKTYGNFAIEGNEAFMVLNRYYDSQDNDPSKAIDYTTYIDPSKYNYIFAETGITSQNFWVQLGFGIKARRVMSAKQIPNL